MCDTDFEYNTETNTVKITNKDIKDNDTIIIGNDNIMVELTTDGEVASVTIEDIQF